MMDKLINWLDYEINIPQLILHICNPFYNTCLPQLMHQSLFHRRISEFFKIFLWYEIIFYKIDKRSWLQTNSEIQNFEVPWVKHLVLVAFRIVNTTYLNELLKYGQMKPIMGNKICKPIIIHLKLLLFLSKCVEPSKLHFGVILV